MKNIILISCGRKKRSQISKAHDLYISPLFTKNLQYAHILAPDKIFILSAKHGLVDLDHVIIPYNKTLNNMPVSEVKQWAQKVLDQLSNHANADKDHFIFLAGAKYRKYLLPHLTHVEVPFEGLTIGKQLQKLNKLIKRERMDQSTKIKQQLLTFGKTIPPEEFFQAIFPEASRLVTTDPYAFTIAVCLDRGMKAEIVWTIPYDIQQKLGHLNPEIIYRMSLEEIGDLFSQLPRRPRYINDAPKTLQELTRIVVEECDGNAARIWRGQRAAEVNRTFISIHGVGAGIANMGVLLIEACFDVRFSDLDRTRMDIKPDVHTKRVLYRLGVSEEETEEAAITATRMLHPEYPGELDGALWRIGRKWCFSNNPNCTYCPMRACCLQRF